LGKLIYWLDRYAEGYNCVTDTSKLQTIKKACLLLSIQQREILGCGIVFPYQRIAIGITIPLPDSESRCLDSGSVQQTTNNRRNRRQEKTVR